MLQEAGHIKNTVYLIFHCIQCLNLMNSEVAWVLVSLGHQVLLQIILDPDYLLGYLWFLMTMFEHNSSKSHNILFL